MKDDTLMDQTREHAAAGYTNVQETIRFVDTKAGVLTGLAAVITGFPVFAMQWLADREPESAPTLSDLIERYPAIMTTWICLLVAGMACGCISLWLALDATTARPPSAKVLAKGQRCRRATSRKRRTTVLFPVGSRYGDAKYVLQNLREGMTACAINKEYARQLLRVGSILERKMRKLRRAVAWFQIQLLVYGLVCVSCVGLFFYAIATEAP